MRSDKYGFLFIHIPKTAGNSIAFALSPYSECALEPAKKIRGTKDDFDNFWLVDTALGRHKHLTLKQYADFLGENKLEQYFVFTCIRNPWDRIVSLYFHRKLRKGDDASREAGFNRQEFAEFIDENTGESYNDFKSYLDFVSIDGEVRADAVIRYENLQEGFNRVCAHLNLPTMELPHKNRSRHKGYVHYYDPQLSEMVRQKYIKDIAYFGYRFGE